MYLCSHEKKMWKYIGRTFEQLLNVHWENLFVLAWFWFRRFLLFAHGGDSDGMWKRNTTEMLVLIQTVHVATFVVTTMIPHSYALTYTLFDAPWLCRITAKTYSLYSMSADCNTSEQNGFLSLFEKINDLFQIYVHSSFPSFLHVEVSEAMQRSGAIHSWRGCLMMPDWKRGTSTSRTLAAWLPGASVK